VRLSARRGGDGRLELRVEDDGPGVAPSLREQIFKPFVTSKAQGTGLGLAICRKIVEEHGGAISAGTSDLGGASFCIQLPLRA
jgi:signal transduction histidine kinase